MFQKLTEPKKHNLEVLSGSSAKSRNQHEPAGAKCVNKNAENPHLNTQMGAITQVMVGQHSRKALLV